MNRGGKNIAETSSSPNASLSKVTPYCTAHVISLIRLFIGHSFFEPQPIRDAAVFFLKAIIHDWSDEKSRIILGHLRDAATPTTRLLIMDRIVPYAYNGVDKAAEGIPGLLIQDIPDVLPPNLGSWGLTTYHIDLNVSDTYLMMLSLCVRC